MEKIWNREMIKQKKLKTIEKFTLFLQKDQGSIFLPVKYQF